MGRDVEYPLNATLLKNLEKLLTALNVVRKAYGKPMLVTSGYRPGKYNEKAGGAKQSAHLTCEACDFADPQGSLARWCISNLPVLQKAGLWMESPARTKGWVHLDTKPRPNRVFEP